MLTESPGVQVDRRKGIPEALDSGKGTLYYYYCFVVPEVDQRKTEAGLPTFEVLQVLEDAGHFDYLAGEEEDIYTPDDGQPVG